MLNLKWEKADRLYRDASDRLTLDCSRSPFQQQWACGSGCSACCFQTVPVTPVEALQLANDVRERLSDGEQKQVVERLRENAEHYSATPNENRVPGIRCAFLDDSGCCRVHSSRPLRCRGHYSLSRNKCEAVLRGAEKAIPTDSHARVFMRGTQSGLSGALRWKGLDGSYYELHSAVLRALETATEKRWAQGEEVFSSCEKTNSVPDVVLRMHRGDGSIVDFCRVTDAAGNPSVEADTVSRPIAWQFNVT